MLFDLSKDVGETSDLSKSYPDIVKTLREKYRAWEGQMSEPLWTLEWPRQ